MNEAYNQPTVDEAQLMLPEDVAVIPMTDGVQLRRGDEEIYTLRGEPVALLAMILERLSENSNRQDILDAVGHQHAELLESILHQLASRHLLTDGSEQAEDGIHRYLRHFLGDEPLRALDLSSCTVSITGHPPVVGLMAQNLREHHLTIKEEPWADDEDDALPESDVVVCLWERPDLHRIEQVNAAACRAGRPVLFVDLSHGRHATIGPFFIPGEGACYSCYRDRLRQNAAAYPEHVAAEQWMREHRSAQPGYGVLPTFRYQVVGLAGSELVAFVTRHRPLRTLNRAITVDLERLTSWSEPVWRVPWCPTCRTP